MFIDKRFPENIAYGSTGGASYSTNVQILQSGHEQRNINWLNSRHIYDISTGVKCREDLNEIIAFFHIAQGRANSFKFKDWSDFQATSEEIAISEGAITEFQLIKNYEVANHTKQRIINCPVNSTVKIYIDGVLASSGYVIDYQTGIVTFATAPLSGEVITADFEFDVPVRFDSDEISSKIIEHDTFQIDKIELIEVRL